MCRPNLRDEGVRDEVRNMLFFRQFWVCGYCPVSIDQQLTVGRERTLTGIPIAGKIVSSMNGKFTGLILFTAASYAGALFFFVAARIVGGGKKWRTVY